jgi:ATP-dependent DNA helicase PIF1
LRNGEITVDDWKLLMTTTPAHITDTSSFDTSLHLFPTAEAVVDFNLYNLHACGQPVATIQAVHSGHNASKASPDDTGGLDPVVCLCKGARVMLSSNLWIDMGLVNRAMGTVQAVCYCDGEAPPNLPVAVTVLFDRYYGPTLHEGTVPIVPICQLPLKLSWAVTIHKSQGLTLDQVIIDIGNKEFCAGLTFVAISCVRCLSNMILTPPFTFQRLQNISKSRRLNERIMEEQRLQSLEYFSLRHLSK